MILKRIASICFAIAFLMALVLFADFGRTYISYSTAKLIFIVMGALGLLFNLLSFRSGKQNAGYNLFFWSGAIILFIGMVFQQMRWPYSFYIMITGMAIMGISFFITKDITKEEPDENQLLDDF